MVCPDNQLIGCLKDLVKPKSQNRQNVLYLAVPRRTKSALVGIFIFQFFNFILLSLYPVSTAVSSLLIYLSNNTLNGRPRGPNLGQPFGH